MRRWRAVPKAAAKLGGREGRPEGLGDVSVRVAVLPMSDGRSL